MPDENVASTQLYLWLRGPLHTHMKLDHRHHTLSHSVAQLWGGEKRARTQFNTTKWVGLHTHTHSLTHSASPVLLTVSRLSYLVKPSKRKKGRNKLYSFNHQQWHYTIRFKLPGSRCGNGPHSFPMSWLIKNKLKTRNAKMTTHQRWDADRMKKRHSCVRDRVPIVCLCACVPI